MSNLMSNLPSTLEGACHLGVQVHKGDHKCRGYNYHDKVKDSLKSLESEIKDCSNRDIIKKIDGIARSILRKINSFTLPLSTAHKDFHPSKESGCKGCETIPEHRASK